MVPQYVDRSRELSRWYVAWGGVFMCFGFLLLATSASAFSEEVVYESDFSSDPGWVTDQPNNFYWDAAAGALFARTMNQPDPTVSKSRYFYTETTLNPRLSYTISWDMKILGLSPSGNNSGVAVFGLFGDELYGFNELNIVFVGNEQDGSFSIRLMTLDGVSRYILTTSNPGYNLDTTTSHIRTFGINNWYRFTLRYDAPALMYYYEMYDRASGQLVFSTSIHDTDPEPVNPVLQNLGLTMHPEGTGVTNLNTTARINGYAEYLIDNVEVRQVYEETYTEPPSVLFLPGIQASRLYKERFIGTEDRLWEPNTKGDVRDLAMTEEGVSIEPIYTRDALGAIFGVTDIYEGFETYLDSLVTAGAISDWHTYAYDWRYAVDEVVENGTAYEDSVVSLVTTVEELARRNNSPVTIVAHSNGGLLAKALMAKLEAVGRTNIIDQIIFVGSPQLGTPKAVGTLLHGYDQQQLQGWLIDEVTARDVLRNMPAVYALLPTAAYMDSGESVVSFAEGSSTDTFVAAYGSSITTHEGLQDFLIGTSDGRPEAVEANEVATVNQGLLLKAAALQDTLQNWRAPENVPVTEIVGVGFDTVKHFRYEGFQRNECEATPSGLSCTLQTYYEPVAHFTQYGDETVVARSARGYEGEKTTYYVDLLAIRNDPTAIEVTHSDLLKNRQIQKLIESLVQKDLVSVPYISTSQPDLGIERDVIAVHSPVVISATDSSGRATGRVGEGPPTMEIPGSSYYEIAGAKYLILPSATHYTVEVRGRGETSGYTLTIDSLVGESLPVPVARFRNATVTPEMIATFEKDDAGFGDVAIDYDGDGKVDSTKTLNGGTPASVLYNELRAVIGTLTLLKESERSWLVNAVDRAQRTAVRKGDDASGVVHIFGQIDGRLVTYLNQTRITQADYNRIKELMGQIFSNK